MDNGDLFPEVPRVEKKKVAQADPSTNAKAFMDRVVASRHDIDIVFKRDAKLVKDKLVFRKFKVDDPQSEMWFLLEKFIGGAIDHIFTMRGKPHNIPTFIYHYANLMELLGNRNGHTSSSTVKLCPVCGKQKWKCNLDRCTEGVK